MRFASCGPLVRVRHNILTLESHYHFILGILFPLLFKPRTELTEVGSLNFEPLYCHSFLIKRGKKEIKKILLELDFLLQNGVLYTCSILTTWMLIQNLRKLKAMYTNGSTRTKVSMILCTLTDLISQPKHVRQPLVIALLITWKSKMHLESNKKNAVNFYRNICCVISFVFFVNTAALI